MRDGAEGTSVEIAPVLSGEQASEERDAEMEEMLDLAREVQVVQKEARSLLARRRMAREHVFAVVRVSREQPTAHRGVCREREEDGAGMRARPCATPMCR